MLNKCVDEVIPEDDIGKYNFYIADSKGVPISSGGSISMDLESSGENTKEYEWTLERYIKLSRIKYPSKARFFCVMKDKGS